LRCRPAPWPRTAEFAGGSTYRERFRQGATMVPRITCVVERVQVTGLGGAAGVPQVRSRRTAQEKNPWKSLEPLQGRVEAEFLRPLYLGESVAPYRLLEPVLAIVPWEEPHSRLLDAAGAMTQGYPHLGGWLRQAEQAWAAHAGSKMTLRERWDYNRELSSQFP